MEARARYVLDASVALKWLVVEPGREAALALKRHDLAAPALLRTEVANALWSIATRGRIPAAQAMALLATFQATPVTLLPSDDALEHQALDLAFGLNHPVYDCVYLALALRTGRRLVTADARFLRALAGSPHAGQAVALDHA